MPVITQTCFAIGHRRGRRHVLLHLHVVARADDFLPADLAVFALDRQQQDLVVPVELRQRRADGLAHVAAFAGGGKAFLGGGDEDRVFPDDRRGGAPTGHFGSPDDVFGFAPAYGQIPGSAARPVEMRPAPLRPVFGGSAGSAGGCKRGDANEAVDRPSSTAKPSCGSVAAERVADAGSSWKLFAMITGRVLPFGQGRHVSWACDAASG